MNIMKNHSDADDIMASLDGEQISSRGGSCGDASGIVVRSSCGVDCVCAMV